ncbi:MAG: glycosyl hydrolase 115 family protein [Lachnospiraceae bacterium]|nr:glycosyl hydrolase 115 family protein [Lachnospiraceae bacterium]
MGVFKLYENGISADIVVERDCPEGVRKVAEVVADDIEALTGLRPRVLVTGGEEFSDSTLTENIIMVNSKPSPDTEGKREVYELSLNDCSKDDYLYYTFLGVRKILNIYGSDKRGLIYGLFAVSEQAGISPLIWWGDIRPIKTDHIALKIGSRTDPDRIVSKEPSIKYRGFFINDEWPAFGRWCEEKFGGFTAKMYEQVFILLLRLHGNYMWPAMWSSTFSEDGPGIESARLADIYGVIMGTSHHEPLFRAGEEWQHIYRKYGNDNTWSFISNRDAITAFWREGIWRNRDFESIITIGMRGEQDSKLLGENAGLAENINVLKDVILTQHRLIRENMECDMSRVPRMLAIYKEVEDYYYGEPGVPGLRDWDELEDVIFLLSDDNFGNTRGLPDEVDRAKHTGGYGMYYHFDYHGAPVSYEWVNSTRLTKTRDQMMQAYEHGVKDLWIVNVGDLKGNEYPLGYFMSLAYDYDRWSREDAVEEYANSFIRQMSCGKITMRQECSLITFIDGFTKWNSIRRPEAMNPGIFSPKAFDEAARVHAELEELSVLGRDLRRTFDQRMTDAFDSIFYYAGMASMNLMMMHIEAGLNKYYCERGDSKANEYAEMVKNRIESDREYIKGFHTMLDGKWNHMLDSAHTGFVTWNDEGWSYPVVHTVGRNEIHAAAAKYNGARDTSIADADEVILIKAENVSDNHMINGEGWHAVPHLGRLGAAIKAFPITKTFEDVFGLPYVRYDLDIFSAGMYAMEFVFMARNPVVKGGRMRIRYSINGGDMNVIDSVGEDYRTEWQCEAWNKGVMTGVHRVLTAANFKRGSNILRIYPFDPNVVLEKIVIWPFEKKLPYSYLGPE